MTVHESNPSRQPLRIEVSGPAPAVPVVTAADLERAHAVFLAREPRDLFYKVATDLVDMAFRGASHFTLAEAIAVLLQTWNGSYYRYRKFDERHFVALEKLLDTHEDVIAGFRGRTISEITDHDAHAVVSLFHAFEMILGPVGAAKALHLLAPRVFPLWDRHIAEAYSHELGRAGSNEMRYWHFLQELKRQCATLGHRAPENALKAIDEYNYVTITKQWMHVTAPEKAAAQPRR